MNGGFLLIMFPVYSQVVFERTCCRGQPFRAHKLAEKGVASSKQWQSDTEFFPRQQYDSLSHKL